MASPQRRRADVCGMTLLLTVLAVWSLVSVVVAAGLALLFHGSKVLVARQSASVAVPAPGEELAQHSFAA